MRGVQVRSAGWVRARGRDSGDRTAGTRSRTWALASSVQTGTRLPLAARAATAVAWAQGRACSGGLGGPAALTATVSPKTVTSFLLARLERPTLIRMRLSRRCVELSLFSQLESCRILKEVFSRETESCKFHKGDVVLEPTGDGVKPESVCILESGLAAVSLGRRR